MNFQISSKNIKYVPTYSLYMLKKYIIKGSIDKMESLIKEKKTVK